MLLSLNYYYPNHNYHSMSDFKREVSLRCLWVEHIKHMNFTLFISDSSCLEIMWFGHSMVISICQFWVFNPHVTRRQGETLERTESLSHLFSFRRRMCMLWGVVKDNIYFHAFTVCRTRAHMLTCTHAHISCWVDLRCGWIVIGVKHLYRLAEQPLLIRP